jgi:hypothetical protein
MHMTD